MTWIRKWFICLCLQRNESECSKHAAKTAFHCRGQEKGWTKREEGQKGIRNESKSNELAEFWFSTEKPEKMKANAIKAQPNQKQNTTVAKETIKIYNLFVLYTLQRSAHSTQLFWFGLHTKSGRPVKYNIRSRRSCGLKKKKVDSKRHYGIHKLD